MLVWWWRKRSKWGKSYLEVSRQGQSGLLCYFFLKVDPHWMILLVWKALLSLVASVETCVVMNSSATFVSLFSFRLSSSHLFPLNDNTTSKNFHLATSSVCLPSPLLSSLPRIIDRVSNHSTKHSIFAQDVWRSSCYHSRWQRKMDRCRERKLHSYHILSLPLRGHGIALN